MGKKILSEEEMKDIPSQDPFVRAREAVEHIEAFADATDALRKNNLLEENYKREEVILFAVDRIIREFLHPLKVCLEHPEQDNPLFVSSLLDTINTYDQVSQELLPVLIRDIVGNPNSEGEATSMNILEKHFQLGSRLLAVSPPTSLNRVLHQLSVVMYQVTDDAAGLVRNLAKAMYDNNLDTQDFYKGEDMKEGPSSEEQAAEGYIKNAGRYCPVCGGSKVRRYWQDALDTATPGCLKVFSECVDELCGAAWTDIYTLTGIEAADGDE
jgi:hypothetical protein